MCGSASYDCIGNRLLDCTGDNISIKNKYYSELTGIYWVWKNTSYDIVGFVHYRRYLRERFSVKPLKGKSIIKMLNKYDIILRNNKRLNSSVKQNFINSIGLDNYNIVTNLICSQYPEYYESFLKCMNEKRLAANSMFITDRNKFNSYCEFFFDICGKLEKVIDYNSFEKGKERFYGYLSERLLIVWIYKNKFKVYYNPMYNVQWLKFLKLKLLRKTEKK